MRLTVALSALLAVLSVSAATVRRASPASITGTRKTSLLQNVAGLPSLPSAAAAAATTLDTDQIQADIMVGMKKKKEIFYFFSINDVPTFQSKLASDIQSIITTTTQMLSVSTQPLVAVNLAFSASGLTALNVSTSDTGDALFNGGQAAQANNLNDPGTTNWVTQFVGTSIHGVFLLASDDDTLLAEQVTHLEDTFGAAFTKQYSLEGSIRPGAEAGHEMFGFLDGIAQPSLIGFSTPLPGQAAINPGVIVVGETGDNVTRPSNGWMTGGSFLAFRQLEQRVPEFNAFLLANAPNVTGKTQAEAAEFLGARMVGRWKSGAPIDLSPLNDDPTLGADPQRNNNFDFTHTSVANFTFTSDQSFCPFSAHIRKTRPRADLNAPANMIMRAGIPYGPEVSDAEAAAGTTDPSVQRGLAFVSYQAQLAKGFQFLQKNWASTPNFVFGKSSNGTTIQPGFDPIIGANHGASRTAVGLDPSNPLASTTMPFDFVVSHGGEYFFSPPVSAIGGILAGVASSGSA